MIDWITQIILQIDIVFLLVLFFSEKENPSRILLWAIVMIFLYVCMVCLMIGAEINVHFHREIDWFTFRMLPHFIRKRRKNPPTKQR